MIGAKVFRYAARVVLALFLCLGPLAATAAVSAGNPPPLEVDAGAYILRLMNVSPKDGSFDVDMWVWFRWKGGAVDPVNSFEIANGIITNRQALPTTLDGDV